MSSDGEEILSKWPPKSVVCIIDDALICELTGLNVHDSQYVDHLAQLTSLDLHLRDGEKGKIRRIENLTKLPLLSQLNLSYNALHKMEGLGSLRQLVELNLAENSLTRIEGIFHMKQLERLNLCGNLIERVPSSVTALRSLSALRLHRNRLSELRDLQHFRELPTLLHLRVDNNLFPSPLPSTSSSSQQQQQLLRHLVLQAVTPPQGSCSVQVLDNQSVTPAERAAAAAVVENLYPQPTLPSSSDSTSSSSISTSISSGTDMQTEPPPPPSASAPPGPGREKDQPLDLGLLKQRLVAEQRRAELLEEEVRLYYIQYAIYYILYVY